MGILKLQVPLVTICTSFMYVHFTSHTVQNRCITMGAPAFLEGRGGGGGGGGRGKGGRQWGGSPNGDTESGKIAL